MSVLALGHTASEKVLKCTVAYAGDSRLKITFPTLNIPVKLHYVKSEYSWVRLQLINSPGKEA